MESPTECVSEKQATSIFCSIMIFWMLPDLLLNPHAFDERILNCFTLFLVLVLVTIEFTGLVHVVFVESQLVVGLKSLLLLRFNISASLTD